MKAQFRNTSSKSDAEKMPNDVKIASSFEKRMYVYKTKRKGVNGAFNLVRFFYIHLK